MGSFFSRQSGERVDDFQPSNWSSWKNVAAFSTAENWPQTIELYDLDRILEIMIENNIGISNSEYLLTEVNTDFWDFVNE